HRRTVSVTDFELDLQLPTRCERDNVLKQTHVIILEPYFTKIVGDFKDEAVAIKIARAQRFEPQLVSVSTQHRAKMLLREIPNFFSGSLHFLSPKSPFFGLFIHLAS